MQKIIQFEKNEDRYVRLADVSIEKEDYVSALGFLFNALSLNRSAETLMDIADVYAQMGLYELSNKYWFFYMEKAQKEKVSIAYEELAINFFYMDDFLTSSFYFHQKLTVDGYLSKDGLDQEIIEFFSGEEFKKNAYYIAYPFEKADYSFMAKRAKRALSSGNFLEAIKLYEKIPVECRDEEISGDLSVSYLMNDQPDKSASVARDWLAKNGDNVTSYCNLSNVYDFKEDYEKSEYYYKKALSSAKGDKNEEFKLATCAIERGDHDVVKKCLKKIISERPFDTTMRFFYGVSQLNTGDIEGGCQSISTAYRIDPSDKIFKFFAEYSLKLCQGKKVENYSPIKYLKCLPESVEENYKKKLLELTSNPNKISFALKKQEYKDMVEWGLYAGEEIARKCAYILACDFSAYSKKTLKNYLLDSEAESIIKQVIVYALTINGVKEKLGIIDRNFFFRIKAKKINAEREENQTYICAYALALSRMAFLGIEDLDKIAEFINKIYSRFDGVLSDAEVNSEELASLAVFLCKFQRFQTEKEIMRAFEIKKEKLQLLLKLYKGEKND